MTNLDAALAREWLETDGLGGFCSGTVGWVRTRRYHALLLCATTPPTGRMVLVDGFDAWIESGEGAPRYLTAQHYAPDTLDDAGPRRITAFQPSPWPAWSYALDASTELNLELFLVHETPTVALRWWLTRSRPGLHLVVRPFVSGRDFHSLQHENTTFNDIVEQEGEWLRFHPYHGVPAFDILSNGVWTSDPMWYRNFMLDEERARGLDCVTDLAAPGTLRWDLGRGDAVWMLSALPPDAPPRPRGSATDILARLRRRESRRRATFRPPMRQAADAYLVRRGEGRTIIAGYPWFTDWGRDTFIAMRGLCLATGQLEAARGILLAWAGLVSRGMLPNRFVENGGAPEYGSVDAALWYAVAVREYLDIAGRSGSLPAADRSTLLDAIQAILEGYAAGTRHGIGMDDDGLLLCGEPGTALTWMDARVGGHAVTPRIGKPVEVQALWVNALDAGAAFRLPWAGVRDRAVASFQRRFWHPGEWLYDVVDIQRQPGVNDPTFRPNQIFAVGGLPVSLLTGIRARMVLEHVERHLWTPMGLRSLAPEDPGYVGHYRGSVPERDGAYHQGTVWPWLAGPFVEAWVKVRGNSASVRREARDRYLAPLLAHLGEAGIGHVSEVADGDSPHAPGGCPFQAWSLGEVLRLDRVVLAPPTRRRGSAATARSEAEH